MMKYRQSLTVRSALLAFLALMIFTGVHVRRKSRLKQATLRGVVVTAAPDGQSYNIPGASLKLKQGTQVAETSANDSGEYEFAKLLPRRVHAGSNRLKVSRRAARPSLFAPAKHQLKTSELEVADVTASVTVTASAQGVQTTETAPTNTIKQNTLQTLPLPNEQLLDALPMVPGVVRGPDGQINMNGARAKPECNDRQQRERNGSGHRAVCVQPSN